MIRKEIKMNQIWLLLSSRILVGSVFVFAILTTRFVHADDLGPQDVIEKMRKTYSIMTSYSGKGVVEIVVSTGGQEQTIVKPFAITFKRPESLRVDWTDYFGGVPTPYVLWNATNGVFKYAKRMNQLGTCESIGQAIGGHSGSSGGSVQHVPDMLLGVLKKPQFSDLNDMKAVTVTNVDGVACYKVSGTRNGNPVDLWIGKDGFVLRKVVTSTSFGVVTELHKAIKVNVDIADTETSFTPPNDAERVDKFDVRKNSTKGGNKGVQGDSVMGN